ncbi:spore coat protein [Paenibacillus sp. MY03]|jgi:spore coat protein CotF|uniref:spore coat protein n=1 Tax=Paenibacillus sp. MY03 TaxID=302980 RepID=UPI000B3CC0F7|nr:spore coat protein [Paenibacillus sp. MY03]OUS78175.1 spore coat protein [Paenibacillus sp. MY03]
MNHQANKQLLSEEDLASIVLSDLKRVVREYATAATESTCPDMRQLFTKLLNNTLNAQGQLFTAMQQANMYNTASPALRQELDKQAQQYKQTQQQTKQFLQQNLGGQQQSMYVPAGGQQQGSQSQHQSYFN